MMTREMGDIVVNRVSGGRLAEIKVVARAQPAVRKAAMALRADSLAAEPGGFLGSEDELILRYRVSRPTLRQAAALVGQEQLVTVRRGAGGGYFALRPDVSGIVHMSAILLELQGARIEDMLRAIEGIRLELIALAATTADDEVLERLAAFVASDEAIAEADYDFAHFVEAERSHNQMVGEASGNVVLHLFLQIVIELVWTRRPPEDALLGPRARYLEWRSLRNRMIRAVVARNAEGARSAARRCGARVREWLDEDAKHAAARRRTHNRTRHGYRRRA